MILASRVINAGRDRNALFTREKHPDPVALRFLSDYHRDLFGKAALVNPSAVAIGLQIEFPFVDDSDNPIPFEEGYPLPANKGLQDGGTVRFADSHNPPRTPLSLVAWENRLNPRFRYSGWVQAGRLYLTGTEDETWKDAERIDIEYIPEPVDLTRLSDEILVPDGAYLTCVEQVAAFFGVRSGIDLSARAAGFETRFLEELRRSRPAQRIPRYRRS